MPRQEGSPLQASVRPTKDPPESVPGLRVGRVGRYRAVDDGVHSRDENGMLGWKCVDEYGVQPGRANASYGL
jgi:hypothetical protein